MSRRIRAFGIGIAALTIAASGVLVTATAQASSRAAVVRPHPAVPPLDHFLCYHVKGTSLKVPAGVLLKNWVQPNPFMPKFSTTATHCNPTIKQVKVATTGVLRTYKVLNKDGHLLCVNITFQYTPRPVYMSNQFGKAVMLTSPGPTSFCLPSWKNRTAPPKKAVPFPPRLDHFTCYGLKILNKSQYNFVIPPLVKVKDEFSAPNFTQLKTIAQADKLCVPTTKIIPQTPSQPSKVYPPQGPNDYSLVCYPINKTPYWKSFYDQNQFGTAKAFPTPPPATLALPFEELCLPSTAMLG